MSSFKCVLTFTIGAAIGSAVTWKLLKSRYERFAQEEIDSVKEVFSRRVRNDNNQEVDEVENDVDESEYEGIVKKTEYINYSDMHEGIPKKESKHIMKANSKPYVIPPEEFGEKDDYECLSLTYYADDILADDDDELIEDVDNTVGVESLTHFGEYEDDSVFVRNDAKKCDYEILIDKRKYSDVTGNTPHQVED